MFHQVNFMLLCCMYLLWTSDYSAINNHKKNSRDFLKCKLKREVVVVAHEPSSTIGAFNVLPFLAPQIFESDVPVIALALSNFQTGTRQCCLDMDGSAARVKYLSYSFVFLWQSIAVVFDFESFFLFVRTSKVVLIFLIFQRVLYDYCVIYGLISMIRFFVVKNLISIFFLLG